MGFRGLEIFRALEVLVEEVNEALAACCAIDCMQLGCMDARSKCVFGDRQPLPQQSFVAGPFEELTGH